MCIQNSDTFSRLRINLWQKGLNSQHCWFQYKLPHANLLIKFWHLGDIPWDWVLKDSLTHTRTILQSLSDSNFNQICHTLFIRCYANRVWNKFRGGKWRKETFRNCNGQVCWDFLLESATRQLATRKINQQREKIYTHTHTDAAVKCNSDGNQNTNTDAQTCICTFVCMFANYVPSPQRRHYCNSFSLFVLMHCLYASRV